MLFCWIYLTIKLINIMKELLIKLLNHLESFSPIDNDPIITNCSYVSGLCGIFADMLFLKIITSEEYFQLNDFLSNEIKNPTYKNYPITSFLSEYGERNSLFFFKPRDWTIRKKWLTQIINTL